MIYDIFHLLKQYQLAAPEQIEHVTLPELNRYAADLRKEEPEYDLSYSYRNNYSSNDSR